MSVINAQLTASILRGFFLFADVFRVMKQKNMKKRVAEINPFDREVVESPWEFFSLLREQSPVYQLPNKAYYLVSRYEDVMQAVMDTETFSSNLVSVLMVGDEAHDAPDMLNLTGGVVGEAQATDVLAIADPPQHTRQRRVANRAFTMRRVKAMDENIRALSHSLIDQFESSPIDWVQAFAMPLPMTLIIQLLGFPLADMPQLKRWSDASVALLSGINTPEQLVEYGTQINQMIGYLAGRYDEAYQQPGDNLLGDLIKEAKIDDGEFGRDEIVSMLVQLLSAGNETTSSLIGSAMWLLLQDSDLQAQLRQSPDKIDHFIEEVLRLESPFHGHFRLVTRDTSLAGTALKKGDRLMLLWSSTGRDESQFENANTVRLNRVKPKSHLAFGYGIHHCIGAALARAEARIAFQTILERTTKLSLSPDNDFSHIPSLFIRSLRRLNIEIH